MSFGVGDLVECVDARPPRNPEAPPLALGGIYTVRGFYDPGRGEPLGLLLEGIYAIVRGYDVGYCPRRFRPIRKTDISIFRQIVAVVREGQKVRT